MHRLATIDVAMEGDVLVATIDRPGSELNAIDGQLHADLASFFAALKRERGARAALVTSAKRALSAGGDFDWFPTLRSVERLDHLRRDAKQMIWDLLDVEIPVVAAVNGSAVGLAASIVLPASSAAIVCSAGSSIGALAGLACSCSRMTAPSFRPAPETVMTPQTPSGCRAAASAINAPSLWPSTQTHCAPVAERMLDTQERVSSA